MKNTIISYDEYHYQEKVAETIEECFPYKDSSGMLDMYMTGVNNRMNEVMRVLKITVFNIFMKKTSF